MPISDVRAYWLLDDENAVVEAIQADFLDLAQRVTGDAPRPLRSSHNGEPSAYGGLFPAWVFYRVTSEGNSSIAEAQEKMLAREYVCSILVLDRATLPGESEANSGRGYADASTRRGFSAWIKELAAETRIHGRCSSIARSSTASGSHSEGGYAMFTDEARNILWAHSCDIRVIL